MEGSTVTILLATYNRAHLIGETANSIIAQTHQNWQCIIVNDHSTDHTEKICKAIVEKDPRFSYYLKPSKYKKGLSGSRNYGLDIASKKGAQFIQLFDDDDIMHPQKLELQMKPFEDDTTLDLTICCYRKFDDIRMIEFDLEKADDLSCNIQTDNLLKSFFVNEIDLNSPGPLWKANCLLKYRFNEELNYGEEREFYLRIFLHQILNYKPVAKILFWYRKHPESITAAYNRDQRFKEQAMERMRDLFLLEILKHQKAPFFLLKSYLAIGIRKNRKDYVIKIKSYLYDHSNLIDIQYLLLLISTRIKFIWRKKKS